MIASPVDSAESFENWLVQSALPIWSTDGVAADGGFHESLHLDGVPTGADRRARVQARQVWTFCQAGELGWSGPWRNVAAAGLETFHRQFRREDGLYRTLVSAEGAPLDDSAMVYDQAFVLLALSAATAADMDAERNEGRAEALRSRLVLDAHAGGGWRENGDHPFQSNAHMHLLEAALAWEALRPKSPWSDLADEIVELALARFIDPRSGVLYEFFDAAWRPGADAAGRIVEPGHQCEWAWLLTRYAKARARGDVAQAAQRLLDQGIAGLDPERSVLVDRLDGNGHILQPTARLWPQTEWLKAAALLGYPTETALTALADYLLPSGLWRDCRDADGVFLEGPAPASSFYHVIAAFQEGVVPGRARPLG